MIDSQLRLEAYGLMTALFGALLQQPDDARRARLTRMHWRAERRYWRRHEKAYPPGNQTPKWFRKSANSGY